LEGWAGKQFEGQWRVAHALPPRIIARVRRVFKAGGAFDTA